MNEDLLMTWKDIAAYLKCSVRKAQRLERQQLPVKRIRNTKAVWASKAEIDAWLNRQSSHVTQAGRDSGARLFPFRGQLWIVGAGFLLTVASAVLAAYVVTTVLFLAEATLLILSYPRLPDTVYTRALIGIFLIAGVSYGVTTTSLPGLLQATLNMSRLPPASAYLFMAGLRSIPAPILICVSLIVAKVWKTGTFQTSKRLKTAYVVASGAVIAGAALSGLYEMQSIWRANLPILWTLLAGESLIAVVNLTLLVLAYKFFCSPRMDLFYRFMLQCAIACLLIGLTSAIDSRHWTEISRSHLDVLYPQIFKVQNPTAEMDFERWVARHEVDNDLVALSSDPEFRSALVNGEFYRQRFDEPFQMSQRAAIFGFRNTAASRLRPAQFVLIRFPADLVTLLRIEPNR